MGFLFYNLFLPMNFLLIVISKLIHTYIKHYFPTQDIQMSCPPMVRVRLYGDTLATKRKSQSDETPPGCEPTASRVHEFKRLKSVG